MPSLTRPAAAVLTWPGDLAGTYDDAMFRELGYGVLLFLAALIGAATGVGLMTPAVWNQMDWEALLWRQGIGGLVGAIIGGAAWLCLRRVISPPLDWDDPN